MILAVFLVACDDDDLLGPGDTYEETYTFEDGPGRWIGDFAEFSVEMREGMDLVVEERPLPNPLDDSDQAVYLAATNTSDDVFMYLKHEVLGLAANTTYDVVVSVDVASNAPSGCAGIGGPPGESVILKFGASTLEPASVLEGSDVEFNLDKDPQPPESPDTDVVEVGHIGTSSTDCTGEVPFELLSFDNSDRPLEVTTNEGGQFWLFIGTDSGFEGRTDLYYNMIEITAEPGTAT